MAAKFELLRSITISVSVYVCLSICLSVRSYILKTTVQISQNFVYKLPMAVSRTSDNGNATGYVLPFLRMTSFFT